MNTAVAAVLYTASGMLLIWGVLELWAWTAAKVGKWLFRDLDVLADEDE